MRFLLLASGLAFVIAVLPQRTEAQGVQDSPTFPNDAPPQMLPAKPVPIAQPETVAQPALIAPPPAVLPYSPPSPPMPSVFAMNALDGFATRFWFDADFLLWFTKGDRLPPLVTTGSLSDPVPGALGQSGTQVLIGGDYNTQVQPGARFRGGYWFTPEQLLGIDGTFFFLGGEQAHFGVSSLGNPMLTRPFFNANTNREDANLLAYPGYQSGGFGGALGSRLWGADTNLRSMLFRGPSYQISLLGGFRFLDLHDNLRMSETQFIYPREGDSLSYLETTNDRFRTSNQFYGGQIGTDIAWSRGRFALDLLAKIAIGGSVQRSTINGWTGYVASNGSNGQIGAGQLALPSNIGWSQMDQFAFVPEVGLNLHYALNQHWRLTFGYTFLYWSHVFRPGDQIDRSVNTTEFPALAGIGPLFGPQRPTFTFQSTDFWAQGINLGLECRY